MGVALRQTGYLGSSEQRFNHVICTQMLLSLHMLHLRRYQQVTSEIVAALPVLRRTAHYLVDILLS